MLKGHDFALRRRNAVLSNTIQNVTHQDFRKIEDILMGYKVEYK